MEVMDAREIWKVRLLEVSGGGRPEGGSGDAECLRFT